MQFEEAVKLLLASHRKLWFHAQMDKSNFAYCDRWKGGEILSGAGGLLAMQAGHPDEWQLNFSHTEPDCPYEPDECDEGELITKLFLDHVRLYMNLNVYPDINPQGDFIRDHTPDHLMVWNK